MVNEAVLYFEEKSITKYALVAKKFLAKYEIHPTSHSIAALATILQTIVINYIRNWFAMVVFEMLLGEHLYSTPHTIDNACHMDWKRQYYLHSDVMGFRCV